MAGFSTSFEKWRARFGSDGIMPLPYTLPNYLERAARTLDVSMLEIGSANESELDGWKKLFE